MHKVRVLDSTGGHTRKSVSVQILTAHTEHAQRKRGDFTLNPLQPGGRFQPPSLNLCGCCGPWDGSDAAAYGCVTLGKLLNLSVPRFSHVYNEDDNI